MSLDKLQALAEDYFEFLHKHDMALFDKVFHLSARLYSRQNGSTSERSLEEYRQVVLNRPAPKSLGKPKEGRILLVDYLSDCMALLKVHVRVGDNVFNDHLNLIETEAGWQIISKTFTLIRIES